MHFRFWISFRRFRDGRQVVLSWSGEQLVHLPRDCARYVHVFVCVCVCEEGACVRERRGCLSNYIVMYKLVLVLLLFHFTLVFRVFGVLGVFGVFLMFIFVLYRNHCHCCTPRSPANVFGRGAGKDTMTMY